MIKYKVVQLCQQDALSIIPVERITIDMDKTAEHLSQNEYSADNQGVMVTASKDKIMISIYRNGRILVSGTTSKETAEVIAQEVYSLQE